MNLPFIHLPVQGGSQAQVAGAGGSQEQTSGTGGSHTQDAANIASTETTISNNMKTAVGGNGLGADAAQGATDAINRPQLYQDSSSVLYHFREMQRRQVEFIKKRVLLLEKALNAEYQKEIFVSFSHVLMC